MNVLDVNKNCVLFDLDGTLTPPRGKITDNNIDGICKLLRIARVGILTGSDLPFVIEQLPKFLFEEGLEVFSCNGTKHYKFSNNAFEMISCAKQINETLSKQEYDKLLKFLLEEQILFINRYDLSYTGTFITFRGSLINWSPIGRDSSKKQRSDFETLDSKLFIRKKLFDKLNEFLLDQEKNSEMRNLQVKIAGSTSFDIYPVGYDKTYALNYFDKTVHPWFVGDRCEHGGNDKEIYDALKESGHSFCVTSYEETPEIINLIYSKIKSNAS
jgi:phosphomannomutase